MVITVVLRLLAGPLESGDLVGHVEDVSTGATESVRGAAEIVAFARQAAAGGGLVTPHISPRIYGSAEPTEQAATDYGQVGLVPSMP
jgi:hypothetical protein